MKSTLAASNEKLKALCSGFCPSTASSPANGRRHAPKDTAGLPALEAALRARQLDAGLTK